MRVARIVVVSLLLTASAGTVVAQDVTELQQFLLTYRCAVVERLKIVHGTVRPKDRYFIFSLKRDRRPMCNACFCRIGRTSCARPRRAFTSRSPASRVQAGACRRIALPNSRSSGSRLTISDGNYQRMIDLSAGVNFVAITRHWCRRTTTAISAARRLADQ
jgi:hypothetical protein